ncbi:MAG: 2-hydroxy-3-oxopropionate reductase [SAR202 cluster bacterium]|nr:2-hydroxy-3-oxopropionate reductase [SAR202 cluster bacterium]
MPANEKIGFIGLGIMGTPMSRHLLNAGYPVTVWNRTAARMKPLVDAGAAAGTSPADVARKSTVTITMVGDSQDVEAVIAGKNGAIEGATAGSVVVDMSTISPVTSRALARRLAEKGVQLLDAPVTGGSAGAQAATLSILVGGEKAAFDRCLPIFQKLGKAITLVGPSGSGHTAKLANQILVAGCMSGVAEALVFARKAGLDLGTWYEAVKNGAGASWHLTTQAPRVLDGDFSAGYMVKHHRKDLRLIQETAHELGVPLPVASAVLQLYRSLQATGGDELGHQALVRVYEQLAKVEARR